MTWKFTPNKPLSYYTVKVRRKTNKVLRTNGGRPRGTPCKWKGKRLPWKPKPVKRNVYTAKQEKWVELYMKTGNPQLAAAEAYDVPMDTKQGRQYASALGYKNRKNPMLQRKIESSVEMAAKTITFLAQNADNERVRLSAAQDILDRLGHKPVDKLEIEDRRELNDEDYEAIRRVQSILTGVTIEEIKPVEIKDAIIEEGEIEEEDLDELMDGAVKV